MTRKLKALGLALVAMFAFSAVAASAASAQVQDLFTSSVEKTVVTGTSQDNKFTITKGPGEEDNIDVECTTSIFAATANQKTVNQLTIEATYNGTINVGPPHTPHCSSDLGEATIKMNGCDYLLTGKTDAKHNGVSNTHAQVHVVCPVGKEIEIVTPLCTVKVPAQTPTEGGIKFTNENDPTTELDDVKLDITVTGITYTAHGGFCGLGLPTHGNDADYTGTVTATGYEDKDTDGKEPFTEGSQVGITVSS